ncbi:MAG: hypothetical protein MHMPM18_001117 [Marteilia pararefringens]
MIQNSEIFNSEEKQFVIDIIFYITKSDSYESLFQGRTLISLLENLKDSATANPLSPNLPKEKDAQNNWINIFNFVYNFYINRNCFLLAKPFDFNAILSRSASVSPYKEVILASFITLSCFFVDKSTNMEIFTKLESYRTNKTKIIFSEFIKRIFSTQNILLKFRDTNMAYIQLVDPLKHIGSILVDRNNTHLDLLILKSFKQSKNELKSLDCKIFELERIIQKMKSKDKAIVEELKNKQIELEISQSDTIKLSSKCDIFGKEINKYKERNSDNEKKIEELNKTTLLAKEECERTTKALNAAKSVNFSLDSSLKEYKNVIEEKDKKIDNLSKEMADLSRRRITENNNDFDRLHKVTETIDSGKFEDLKMENMKLQFENKYLLEKIEFLQQDNKQNRALIDKAFEQRTTPQSNQNFDPHFPVMQKQIEEKLNNMTEETNNLRRALEEQNNIKSNRRKSISSFFSLTKKSTKSDRRKTLPYNFQNSERYMPKESTFNLANNNDQGEMIFEQYINQRNSNDFGDGKENIEGLVLKESDRL